MTDQDDLLEVRGLRVEYRARGLRREPVVALDGVDLDIRVGEAMGLVGESGSGKSTLGRAILGLTPTAGGTIRFGDRELTAVRVRDRRILARDLQVVFQDPFGSLNPSLTIGETVGEPLLREGVTRTQMRARVRDTLGLVRLPADAADRLPHEFSGGQRQRVAIARALIRRPKLVVCDEAVSALDLTTQAHIVELLLELQRETGVAYLFISHDLSVVRHLCHRVSVLYRGRMVESGDGDLVTSHPTAEYTRRLLAASPVPDPEVQRRRRAIRVTEAAQ